MRIPRSALAFALGLGASITAEASHYVSLTGGYQQIPSNGFGDVFTNNGFSSPSSGGLLLGTRLGNESPEGALRLEAVLNHPADLSQTSGSNYIELSDTRWGFLLQLSLSPGATFSPIVGFGGGIGFAELTVLSATAGVLNQRYFYFEPVVGAEFRLSPDFRTFAEFSYVLPFSSTLKPHGTSTGATALASRHWSVAVGLSFYFSGNGGNGGGGSGGSGGK